METHQQLVRNLCPVMLPLCRIFRHVHWAPSSHPHFFLSTAVNFRSIPRALWLALGLAILCGTTSLVARTPVAVSEIAAERAANPTLWQGQKVYALLVGVAQYSDTDLNLRYCADDAHRVNAFLRSPEGGAVPESHITLVLNEDATQERILAELENTLRQADSTSVVIFFYSGHGARSGLVPYDYRESSRNYVRYDAINRLLAHSRSKTKLVLLDACNSGQIFTVPATPKPNPYLDAMRARQQQQAGGGVVVDARTGKPRLMREEADETTNGVPGKPRPGTQLAVRSQRPAQFGPTTVGKPPRPGTPGFAQAQREEAEWNRAQAEAQAQANRPTPTPAPTRPNATPAPRQTAEEEGYSLPDYTAFLASSASTQTSREFLEGRQGYFTYYLLEGLRGAADTQNADGIITLGELTKYLHTEVARATEDRQVPAHHTSLPETLPIARVRR